jgi:hypothetical protein
VPSDSVLMWLAYARTVLAQVITRRNTYGTTPSEDDVAAFEAYLDEWDLLANRDTEFRWITDADPDKVKQLADTWLHLAEGLADAAAKRGYELQPTEGKAFNDALIVAVLTALASEGLG